MINVIKPIWCYKHQSYTKVIEVFVPTVFWIFWLIRNFIYPCFDCLFFVHTCTHYIHVYTHILYACTSDLMYIFSHLHKKSKTFLSPLNLFSFKSTFIPIAVRISCATQITFTVNWIPDVRWQLWKCDGGKIENISQVLSVFNHSYIFS